MIDHGKVRGVLRPEPLSIDKHSVWVCADIGVVSETVGEQEFNGFEYHLVQYEKDEYIKAIAAQSSAAALVFVTMAETSDAFDSTALGEHAALFANYIPRVAYKAGQIRICPHDGVLYKCITPHGAEHAADKPLAESNLWQRIADPADEWPAWFPASGVFDQWMKGSKCSHSGKHWVSNVDHNVWEPGTPGAPWTEEK